MKKLMQSVWKQAHRQRCSGWLCRPRRRLNNLPCKLPSVPHRNWPPGTDRCNRCRCTDAPSCRSLPNSPPSVLPQSASPIRTPTSRHDGPDSDPAERTWRASGFPTGLPTRAPIATQPPPMSSQPPPFQVTPDTPAATQRPELLRGLPAGPGRFCPPPRRQLPGHEIQVVRLRPARRHLRLPPDGQHRQLRDFDHPGPAGAGPERRAHPAVHPHRFGHRDADQEPGLDDQDADRDGLLQREHVRGVRVVPAPAPLRLGRLRAVPDRSGGVAVHGLRRVPERPGLRGPRRDGPHAAADRRGPLPGRREVQGSRSASSSRTRTSSGSKTAPGSSTPAPGSSPRRASGGTSRTCRT